jgi:hypothetical protein
MFSVATLLGQLRDYASVEEESLITEKGNQNGPLFPVERILF